MGSGFEAQAAHPCPNQIWVPPGRGGGSSARFITLGRANESNVALHFVPFTLVLSLENAFKSKNLTKFSYKYALTMTLWADMATIDTKFELM